MQLAVRKGQAAPDPLRSAAVAVAEARLAYLHRVGASWSGRRGRVLVVSYVALVLFLLFIIIRSRNPALALVPIAGLASSRFGLASGGTRRSAMRALQLNGSRPSAPGSFRS